VVILVFFTTLADLVYQVTGSEIIEFIESVVLKKEPKHFINEPGFVAPSRSMSFIGG